MSPVVKRVQIALTVIGLSGIILSFVPFTGSITPLTDVLLDWDIADSIWLLAAPCIILPFPISIGYAFWLTTGRFPRWASMASYVSSALLAVSSLAGLVIDWDWALQGVLLFGAVLVGGVWLSIQGIQRESMVHGLVLMQTVFIVPMTYWLVLAFMYDGIKNLESGPWFGAVTLLTYLVQIALVAKRLTWILAVVVPMASLAMLMLRDSST